MSGRVQTTTDRKAEPGYVAETLAWCNARRKARGKRPVKRLPKGWIGDPFSCPCGKATGLAVGHFEWRDERGKWISLPRPVKRFVIAFDGGRLPRYEAKP